jgi:hypothetical protein
VTTRVLVATLTAGLVMPSAVACSSGSKHSPTTPVAEVTPTPTPVRLTPQLAKQTFDGFVSVDDVARATGDERLALTLSRDGEAALTAGEYEYSFFHGSPLTRYAYTDTTIFTPRLTTYPQWFVVSATRTPTSPAGLKQSVLMAFYLKSPADKWQLSLVTQLGKNVKLPKLAVDSEGYATPLATFANDVVIPPRSMPSIQATYAQQGPLSDAARVMQPGPFTTGIYTQTQQAVKAANTAGEAMDSALFATNYPSFSLRTTDGGALVIYALSSTTIHYLKKQGGTLAIPQDAAHLLVNLLLPKNQLTVTDTLQYAATDPPAPKDSKTPPGKATVIAGSGAPTSVSIPQSVP